MNIPFDTQALLDEVDRRQAIERQSQYGWYDDAGVRQGGLIVCRHGSQPLRGRLGLRRRAPYQVTAGHMDSAGMPAMWLPARGRSESGPSDEDPPPC